MKRIQLSGLQMKNKLHDFFLNQKNSKTSIAYGTAMHKHLQFIDANTPGILADAFVRFPQLVQMFGNGSKAEVSIAGYVNGRFVSRRIDRLHIDSATKTINVLDFKTDSNKEFRMSHYEQQLGEYKQLLQDAYPDYQVQCYILWTHDWTLVQVI